MNVRRTMCATCPFRKGSKYRHLAPVITLSALGEAARICHSTGKDGAIYGDTGKPEAICRGARDLQLRFFAGLGFIREATDAAWNAKCAEMGIQPNVRTT